MSLDILDEQDMKNARIIADRMVRKHSYYPALYNVMTLMIWCRRNGKYYWSEEELKDITFWWAVREIIWKTRTH